MPLIYKLLITLLLAPALAIAQSKVEWKNVDSLYGPLPPTVHIYYTSTPIDTGAFRAFYLIADLKDKSLDFTTDTTFRRRLTPSQFYERTGQPLVVVNGTFFSFETNNNLNVVINNGDLLAYNSKKYRSKQDTLQWLPTYSSAIGIDKRRRADVAWIKTDSVRRKVEATQMPYTAEGNFFRKYTNRQTGATSTGPSSYNPFSKWKMKTAIGGGPVLIQNGEIRITNEEERMFAGKAINDKHPRTAMGYTADRKLIILMVEGRNKGLADGATLIQEAQLLKDLGCIEALNLDGGGSSCLLINGKETIKPSDKEGQRAVPAVFIIKNN